MKKISLLAIVLAAPAVFAAGVSIPDVEHIQQELLPTADYVQRLALDREVIYRPQPDLSSPGTLAGPGTRQGPIAADTGDMSMGIGGAIVTPRGGAMYSPTQQADRAIDRLIRRLD